MRQKSLFNQTRVITRRNFHLNKDLGESESLGWLGYINFFGQIAIGQHAGPEIVHRADDWAKVNESSQNSIRLKQKTPMRMQSNHCKQGVFKSHWSRQKHPGFGYCWPCQLLGTKAMRGVPRRSFNAFFCFAFNAQVKVCIQTAQRLNFHSFMRRAGILAV